MSRQYSVVEPHPQPSTTSYINVGRGGAGNIVRPSSTITNGQDATGPASRISLSTRRPSNSFISGRGGAGNVHPASERAIFSFDEELQRQLKYEKDIAPVFHTGRGGAGNLYTAGSPSLRHGSTRRDSEAGSVRSTSSADSGADALNRKVRRSLEKFMGKSS